MTIPDLEPISNALADDLKMAIMRFMQSREAELAYRVTPERVTSYLLGTITHALFSILCACANDDPEVIQELILITESSMQKAYDQTYGGKSQ